MEKTCIACGTKFDGVKRQLYCCRKCNDHYNKISRKKQYTYTCKYCGKEYNPKAKDRNTYCSKECSYSDKRIVLKEKEKPICIVCKKTFEGNLNSKYCSDKCRSKINSLKIRERSNANHSVVKLICKECGTEFNTKYGNKHRKFCSDICCKKYGQRVNKIKRTLKILKNGKVDYDITLEKLIRIDKNECHICKCKCSKEDHVITDNGYFIAGASYPSIDHVKPINKGGTHTWDNVRLAHCKCNYIKNDKDMYEDYKGK